jgi:hypothetical protein
MNSIRNTFRTIIAAALLVLATGCADLLTFDLSAEVTEFIVLGNPTLHHQHVPLNSTEVPPITLQMANTTQGSIHLTSLIFYVTETAMSSVHDEDFLDFMTGMDVYVTPLSQNSSLPPLQIASWSGPAPTGAMVIDMEVDSNVDLSQYVAAGFALKVGPAGVVPYDDVSMKGDLTFSVSPF